MLLFHPNHKPNAREKLLEKRIENLQQRIRDLEQLSIRHDLQQSSLLVLPVTYTSIHKDSPRLEIIPSSTIDRSNVGIFETVV